MKKNTFTPTVHALRYPIVLGLVCLGLATVSGTLRAQTLVNDVQPQAEPTPRMIMLPTVAPEATPVPASSNPPNAEQGQPPQPTPQPTTVTHNAAARPRVVPTTGFVRDPNLDAAPQPIPAIPSPDDIARQIELRFNEAPKVIEAIPGQVAQAVQDGQVFVRSIEPTWVYVIMGIIIGLGAIFLVALFRQTAVTVRQMRQTISQVQSRQQQDALPQQPD